MEKLPKQAWNGLAWAAFCLKKTVKNRVEPLDLPLNGKVYNNS